jgi:hypothetical protein
MREHPAGSLEIVERTGAVHWYHWKLRLGVGDPIHVPELSEIARPTRGEVAVTAGRAVTTGACPTIAVAGRNCVALPRGFVAVT